MHVIDTPDADHECKLALLRHIVATLGLGLTSQTDKVLLLQEPRQCLSPAVGDLEACQVPC